MCNFFFFSITKTCTTLHDILATLIKALIALNWFETTWAVALEMSNAFNRVKHAGYLHELKPYGSSGQVFGLISFFSVIIIDGL